MYLPPSWVTFIRRRYETFHSTLFRRKHNNNKLNSLLCWFPKIENFVFNSLCTRTLSFFLFPTYIGYFILFFVPKLAAICALLANEAFFSQLYWIRTFLSCMCAVCRSQYRTAQTFRISCNVSMVWTTTRRLCVVMILRVLLL